MKIGILTLPLHSNYGGVLQAYALQTVLERMGFNVMMLNRRERCLSLLEILLRCGSLLKCLFRKFVLKRKNVAILSPLSEYYTINKAEYLAFVAKQTDYSELIKFAQKYVSSTKPLRNSKSLCKCADKLGVNCFVVGSDQVWRECYSPCITDFFLGFLPASDTRRKVAYAASFGTDQQPISAKWLDRCVELAKRFDRISVREQSGVDYLRLRFGIQAQQTIDPTLLLRAEDYEQFFTNRDDSGVVSYILDRTSEKWAIIRSVLEALSQPHTDISPHPYGTDGIKPTLISVESWLTAIANARFVVTDSFHGCVFSILFHKPFIAIANSDRGLDRFVSLLRMFRLSKRLVFSMRQYEDFRRELLAPVDYEAVDAILQKERAASEAFLREALQAEK